MANPKCGKCSYDAEFHSAPKGKIVRNKYAKGEPVFDDCNACNGTGEVPEVVLNSVRRFSRGDDIKAELYLSDLRWSGDHYSFMCGNMYVGVEVDGYLHT